MMRKSRNGAQLGFVAMTLLYLMAMLTGCGKRAVSPQPADSLQEQLDHAAYTAFHQGNFEEAVRLYDQSLQRAYLRDDAEAIAKALYNLAISHARLHHVDTARAFLQEARTILASIPEAQLADVFLEEAEVAYRQGDLDGAWRLIDEGLKATLPAPDAVKMALHLLRGRIAAERRDLSLARQALAASDQYRHDSLTTAARAQLVGSIALLEDKPLYAATVFDQEADLHRSALNYTAMCGALMRAGEAYADAGAWQQAANRFLRAGRSAQLQGMTREAIDWLERAIATGRKGNAAHIAEQAYERLRLIQRSAKPPSR
jgi:tetratricopeptide (TPR) repeat protein